MIKNTPGSRSAMMARFILGLTLLLSTYECPAQPSGTPSPYQELSPSRIAEITALLPEQPAGFGKPISDRDYWSEPALRKRLERSLATAKSLLKKPFPAWNDAVYLEFSKTGKRTGGDAMLRERNRWLGPLVLAECLENKGRFLPLLNTILAEYVKQPTWVMPAHDSKLNSYHGSTYDVDLGAASFGLELAETLYLLGDRIDPAVRKDILDALRKRVFDPVLESLRTGRLCWWLRGTNNWTAVCLAGTVGAALAVIPDRAERAVFAAAGECYIAGYVKGFSPDGYCFEGVGYWNYGMRNFLLLREELYGATGGGLDLFSTPRVRGMALYGSRILIGRTAVPYFADCRFGTKPSAAILAYCNESLDLGLNSRRYNEISEEKDFVELLMSPSQASSGKLKKTRTADPGRFYFSTAGVLCCRPDPSSKARLGIGIKAGGNGSHSHNDIGSYDISLDDEVLSGDPGGPFWYDSKTFTAERYTRKILNSYGHPVPVVAGKLQLDAVPVKSGHLINEQIHPKAYVTATSFSPERDEITIDFTKSYDVPELKSLLRKMVYEHGTPESIAIEDVVAFSSPREFEDAVVVEGSLRQTGETSFVITRKEARLLMTIETREAFSIHSETIEEMGAPAFTRLGIRLKNPVEAAMVKVTFAPSP